jgi:predicted enzyme related to lactoylglutathione lyase
VAVRPRSSRRRQARRHDRLSLTAIDINERFAALRAAGAEAHQPTSDVGGGTLIATVKDADGNITGLLQAPGVNAT